jgi:predicted NUDIX family NTP pyrophosphohydrolase
MEFMSVLIKHHAGPTGDVLICKNKDGVWEFPHDVIRTNETYEEAVERVAWEQVGIKADPGVRLMLGRNLKQDGIVEHIYEGNITHNTHTKFNYHNYFEAVNKWQYEPKSDVYTEFKWVHASELGEYEFAGDDKNFMAKYDPYINARFIPDVRMY